MKNKLAMIMLVAAMAIMALASVSAYMPSPYPDNYVNYAGYQPRMGAYYGPENFHQTWYGYLDQPRYQNYYGYPWTITNIRPAVDSGIPPVTHQPNIYRLGGYYPPAWNAGYNQWHPYGDEQGYGRSGGLYSGTYSGFRGYNYGGFAY